MIPQSFIQDLLNRVDIVDVVGRYVPLKKGGANFMGLCPFHNEKSSSFTVSPTKQFYHCFGCGVHGTAINFLMEYSGLGFVEAVKDLAQNVGMNVPEQEHWPTVQRVEAQAKNLALSEAMTKASDFYRQQLRGAQQAIAYLKNRGLSGEIALKFGIGYAPDGWDSLRTVFPDYEVAALLEAGLVIDKDDEQRTYRKRYDRFRNRIIFPIRNIKGQVIGFGGRVLGDGEPKYLNSPETPLFQKGNELYGLFEARQAIREAGYVLVTEGYMDVVALAQLGFPQTVATLGTACTSIHVQKLLRHTDNVIFSFDGDLAGCRAARRALDACLPYVADNKTLKFLFLPSEHDPDSYIRSLGSGAFKQLIHNAMPLSQFLLREVTAENDLTTFEGRAKVQYEAKPLLQAMPPSALRLQIVRNLAQLTQTLPAEIEVLFNLVQPVTQKQIAPPRTKRNPPMGLERQIIRLLVAHPVLALEIDDSAFAATANLAPHNASLVMQAIDICRSLGPQASFAALVEQLRNAESDFDLLIAEIAANPQSDIVSARLELAGAIRQAKIRMMKSEMDKLAAAGLKTEDDRIRYRRLSHQQEQLRQHAEVQ